MSNIHESLLKFQSCQVKWWGDGTTTWFPLSEWKESNPIQVATQIKWLPRTRLTGWQKRRGGPWQGQSLNDPMECLECQCQKICIPSRRISFVSATIRQCCSTSQQPLGPEMKPSLQEPAQHQIKDNSWMRDTICVSVIPRFDILVEMHRPLIWYDSQHTNIWTFSLVHVYDRRKLNKWYSE